MTSLPKRVGAATQAILAVGDGRGFVVEGPGPFGPVIITAAHCLPKLPPAHLMSYTIERTYANLIGLLGEKPSVWAECLFADPVSDLAVLGQPDNQELCDQADAYDALVEKAATLSVAEVPKDSRVWLFSLDGKWFPCKVRDSRHAWGSVVISTPSGNIVGGMSGSPIVRSDGAAISVVSIGSSHGQHVNPRLASDLPGWLMSTAGRQR